MNLHGPRALAISIALGVAFLTALASCGGGGDEAGSSAEKTATASASSAVPRCRTRDLSVLRGPSNGATGHIVLGFRVQSLGGPRCSLHGYPGVTLLPRSGRLLHVTVKPSASDFFGNVPMRLVILPRRGLASFRLSLEDAIHGGDCPFARALRVTLPGDPQPRFLRRRFLACPGGVTVSPIAQGRLAY